MCVILGKLAEQEKPTESLLRACWASNPHGGGIMWRENGRINVNKGLMSISEFLKVVKNIPADVETWYHTRIVSRGEICTEQCHPFYLPGDTWYMHNGTFRIEPWQGMSDTQTVAEYLNTKPEESIDEVIGGLCTESYSKAVVMTPEETKLFGRWSEYEGYKVSNLYFVDSLTRSKVKKWSKSRTLCETCEEYGAECYGLMPTNYDSCVFYKRARS